MYDNYYYQEVERQRLADIDFNEVQEYFPLDRVTKGMFSIYEKLMDIKIVKAKTDNIWFEQAEYYHVFGLTFNGTSKLVNFIWICFPVKANMAMPRFGHCDLRV
ncbi:MAG: M3 family metallopeptidase [Bdellovibrionota bacterium]